MLRVCGQDSQRARKEKGPVGRVRRHLCPDAQALPEPRTPPHGKMQHPVGRVEVPPETQSPRSHRHSDQPHLWKFQIPRETAHQCFISAGTVLSQVPRCQPRIASGLQLPAQTPHQRATSPANTPRRERPAGRSWARRGRGRPSVPSCRCLPRGETKAESKTRRVLGLNRAAPCWPLRPEGRAGELVRKQHLVRPHRYSAG